jgi:hypothetical protein
VFVLTKRQWAILRAITQIEARDAARGDFDRAIVEQGLMSDQPTAAELQVVADVVANEAFANAWEEDKK